MTPHRIKLETKFIDIASHCTQYISIALSQNGICFIWGKCGEEIIQTPKPTNFKSFVEIYANFFKITKKAINYEKQNSVGYPSFVSRNNSGQSQGLKKSVDGALSGQVLLMIYSYRTRQPDSEYIYSSRSKRSSQGHVKVKV